MLFMGTGVSLFAAENKERIFSSSWVLLCHPLRCSGKVNVSVPGGTSAKYSRIYPSDHVQKFIIKLQVKEVLLISKLNLLAADYVNLFLSFSGVHDEQQLTGDLVTASYILEDAYPLVCLPWPELSSLPSAIPLMSRSKPLPFPSAFIWVVSSLSVCTHGAPKHTAYCSKASSSEGFGIINLSPSFFRAKSPEYILGGDLPFSV